MPAPNDRRPPRRARKSGARRTARGGRGAAVPLTDAEWKVMAGLWACRGPATARELLSALPADTGWAYTTVKTLLARLVEKGVLAESKRGHVGVYEPLLTRSEARRSAVRDLLERAFDGTFGSLLHFLVDEKELSPRQRERLAELLEQEPDDDAPGAAPPRKRAR